MWGVSDHRQYRCDRYFWSRMIDNPWQPDPSAATTSADCAVNQGVLRLVTGGWNYLLCGGRLR